MLQNKAYTHFYCPNNHPTLYITSDPPSHCKKCKGELLPIPQRGNNTSNSFFSDVERCLRYSYFKHELSLRHPAEDKLAMNAGNIWHEIMRKWHGNREDVFEVRHHKAKEAGLEECKKYPDYPIRNEDHSNRSLEHIFLIFDFYIKYYGEQDTIRPLVVGGDELSEVMFSLVVAEGDDPENPLMIRGVIDLVGIHEEGSESLSDNTIRVFDYKSTSYMTPAKIASYQTDDQATIYIHAIRELFEVDIKWCMFDVVGFYKNIDISKHFQRPLTSRSRMQCEELMEELPLKWAYYNAARQSGIWPKSSSHCLAYNKMCEFSAPCINWGKMDILKARLEGSYEVNIREEENKLKQ